MFNLADLIANIAAITKEIIDFVMPQERFTESTIDIITCLQILRFFRFGRVLREVVGYKVLVHSIKVR